MKRIRIVVWVTILVTAIKLTEIGYGIYVTKQGIVILNLQNSDLTQAQRFVDKLVRDLISFGFVAFSQFLVLYFLRKYFDTSQQNTGNDNKLCKPSESVH